MPTLLGGYDGSFPLLDHLDQTREFNRDHQGDDASTNQQITGNKMSNRLNVSDHGDDTLGVGKVLHRSNAAQHNQFNQQGDNMLDQNGSNAAPVSIVADNGSAVKSHSHVNYSTPISGAANIPGIRTGHVKEWVEDSGVSPEITRLNLVSMSAKQARVLLNWGAPKGNDQDMLADGWWVASVNPHTGEVTDFGQYKPGKPFFFSGKKSAKYLSPSKTKTEAIYLQMPEADYWRKVLEDVSIPVVLTEGTKKSGAGLTIEIPTIALVGVWNGQQAKGAELVDNLKAFAQPGRTFIFAFDADLTVKTQVRMALEQLARLLIKRGCLVKVAQWGMSEGKGLDDLLVNAGRDRVVETIEEAVDFEVWEEEGEQISDLAQAETKQAKIWNYVSTVMSKHLGIDEFSLDFRYKGRQLCVTELQAKLSEMIGDDVPKSYLVDVLHRFAKPNPYSEVREYLKTNAAQHPDAKGYIRQLVDMMGLQKDTEKLLVFKWLVGAVARAMEPGCKFDSVLIQKSVEGLGKTHLMSILAGEEKFYEVTADPSNKDFRQLTVNFWILELGEIEATFRKSDISALKSYITQKMDAFRPPYMSKTEKFPRHFIFCGSTNSDTVITDPDGVRRWWVVEPTKKFDIDWVRQHRDLIWAEAFRHYQLGEPLYLNDVQIEAFKAHAQQYRQTKDFYEGLLETLPDLKRQPFTTENVLRATFNTHSGTKGYRARQMDIAQDLKLLGFENRLSRIGGKLNRYLHYIGSDDAPNYTLDLPF
ncbi:MAG: hypothetical protein N4J56_004612 [Chroococcidiopsis sp. SAG 2025]|uniref:VapE domain-containing protein n=1 Tax=Chroococcidiopsis sp. SAG 2025 TaxID=171389 RepID=UPI002936DFF0|nr:VapE domain-containing protein [Chroococcidiopsis sp. SAG 2025]MDV2994958.1 hypothetical protein [Chroococcidiopsis sp. SAG 2025]